MMRIYGSVLAMIALFLVLLYGVTSMVNSHNDFALLGAVALLIVGGPAMIWLGNRTYKDIMALTHAPE